MSALPLSPPTVEKRTATGVRFPTWEKSLAEQYFENSEEVTSKWPKAPAPSFRKIDRSQI